MLGAEQPTPAALNTAAFIVARLRKLGPVEGMKLQKLLFYANAWSLADRGRPLFDDVIEAWKHGPVVASLHPLLRGAIHVGSWPHGNPGALSAADLAHVDHVVDLYGGLSGWRLRNLSRRDEPWIQAWEIARRTPGLHVSIDPGTTADFYRAQRTNSNASSTARTARKEPSA